MNDESEVTWNETVVASFRICMLFQTFLVGTGENSDKHLSVAGVPHEVHTGLFISP
jgi:hypothetical protein